MADGIRKIVRALHKRAGEDEKKQAKEFFAKLDSNGNGKISKREFEKGVDVEELPSDTVFRQLGSDGDEALSFDDVLVVFYYRNKTITILNCDGCRELIFGPSFSCLECLFKSPHRRFALCCDCYGKGKAKHRHPLSPVDMLQDKALLEQCRKLRDDDPKALAKKEMEKLSAVAKSHYNAASQEVKGKAKEFFKSMDTDGDNGIDLEEFLSFVRENGHRHMHNNQFFKAVDVDGNSRLDFMEVMTLYYIIKSGRPFCKCCADFIPGIYFSCVECFKDPKSSYSICHPCYESGKSRHNHDGRVLFLDNYTLLQTKHQSDSVGVATGQSLRKTTMTPENPDGVATGHSLRKTTTLKNSNGVATDADYATDFMFKELDKALSQPTLAVSKARSTHTPSKSKTHYANSGSIRPNEESSSQAIVPAISPMKMAAVTFQALEAAITIVNLSAMCTIL